MALIICLTEIVNLCRISTTALYMMAKDKKKIKKFLSLLSRTTTATPSPCKPVPNARRRRKRTRISCGSAATGTFWNYLACGNQPMNWRIFPPKPTISNAGLSRHRRHAPSAHRIGCFQPSRPLSAVRLWPLHCPRHVKIRKTTVWPLASIS